MHVGNTAERDKHSLPRHQPPLLRAGRTAMSMRLPITYNIIIRWLLFLIMVSFHFLTWLELFFLYIRLCIFMWWRSNRSQLSSNHALCLFAIMWNPVCLQYNVNCIISLSMLHPSTKFVLAVFAEFRYTCGQKHHLFGRGSNINSVLFMCNPAINIPWP